ncbi:hypothetical protein ACVXSW_001083 [Vibrio parahaemolyticus]|nr:hypothetical protein [Vibrio parahaemolyticus]EKF6806230.1 hypothetical protein [Vibrio parahaemolyticus]
MTLREKKQEYISKITDSLNAERHFLNIKKVIQGTDFAIDCLIENEANYNDKPVIFVSYGDENKCAAKLLKDFCIEHYPRTPPERFNCELLTLPNTSAEEALLKLVEMCRCSPSQFYWADSLHWFKKLPSGTMHVIDFNHPKVLRGLNQQDKENITVNNKSYNQGNLNKEHFGLINLHSSISNSIEGSLADLFYAEAQSLIIRPIPAPIGCKYDNPITLNSPTWQKEACVALRRYQSKECKDGFNWDTSHDGWENVAVYPIVEDIRMIDSQEVRECLIGQVTMVAPKDDDAYLSTAWVHPFHRRQGKLTNLWQQLTTTYGKFEVEQPNTNMQAFVVKNTQEL